MHLSKLISLVATAPVSNSYHPVTYDADNDGSQTFEDEYPCPTRFTANTTHLRYGGCKKTTERSGKGGCREEDCSSYAKLGALIPTA
jgi:hypothetical protein